MSTANVRIPYVDKDVEALLKWRDPKKSGIVFGTCTAAFLFLAFTKMPLLAIILYSLGIAVGACALWARFGRTIGKPMPELPAYLREGVSEEDFKAFTDKLKPHVDQALGFLYALITCKNFALSAKAIGALFFLGKVFTYVSPLVLSYTLVLTAFVAPKVYENNKKDIDEGLASARQQINKGMAVAQAEVNKLMEKVPALKNMANSMSAKAKKVE